MRTEAVFNRDKDLLSGALHAAGALLAIAGLVLLVVRSARMGSAYDVVGCAVYGASLILLYLASTMYHIFHISDRVRATLRKIDHMMIYVLIAGTYTPLCLGPLRGAWGWALFGAVWGMALMGILSKIFWMNAPRWLYTAYYVVMGWAAVVAIWPLTQTLPPMALWLLFGGGVFYSIGGLCYALKWPPFPWKWFGFHEFFHLFCLAGSLCHFIMVYTYAIP